MLKNWPTISKKGPSFLKQFLLFTVIGLFLAFPRVVIAADTLYFIHTDHLASSGLVSDRDGHLVTRRAYYPYGSNRVISGSLPTERQYTGQVSDQAQTGLYYYNARYYDPVISQFTQADTLVGINRYTYVGGNPLVLVDPSGQSCDYPSNLAEESFCSLVDSVIDVAKDFVVREFFNTPKDREVNEIDLLKYQTTYTAGSIYGLVKEEQYLAGYNLLHFLYGSGEPLDLSSTLQDYLSENDFQDILNRADAYSLRLTEDGFKVVVNSFQFPFLGESSEEGKDLIHAMNKFTITLYPMETYSGEVEGVKGTWLVAPLVTIYDRYDWHEGLDISYYLPLFGWTEVSDSIGASLVENKKAREFDITGSAAAMGMYFVPVVFYPPVIDPQPIFGSKSPLPL